ncbi:MULTISPECIES: response regulator [unclassified Oceanispirochaeta]|uniref:response regulator transcription factor n=1 Tax=unclassified Oceanispirochaeta TaxID=2635722 RepID=UPI000E08F5DC|nr:MULTISPECIES: response regulator [unclassified Oceanispirochaeta]MBF9017578.1 response regulator [Oceanispirochaeta sp. M2]NPD74150.1 response regulator [Oceanispirochaeta sp. M1]RDG30069.1 response regulator [Oceanispirochaeta sp. M1]
MKLKVLLIDDEYLVRERLKHVVDWDAEGYTICGEAEDGVRGLELIEEHDPDLAVIDINMPFMSGLEMAEKVQELEKKVRLVILSGYDDFEYARSAIRSGVCCYLLKPVNKDELLEVLRSTKKEISGPIVYSKSVQQVLSFIEENYKDMNLSIELIADFIGINPTYLSSKYKKETGRKLVDEINLCRLNAAEAILKKECCTLQELADRVGYNDPYYMSRCFKKYLGYSPSQIKSSR